MKDKSQSIHVRGEISSHYRDVKKRMNGIFYSEGIKNGTLFIPNDAGHDAADGGGGKKLLEMRYVIQFTRVQQPVPCGGMIKSADSKRVLVL